MKKDRSLTDGPILKKLLLFAMPMMAGNLLQQIYNIVDTLIVGRLIGADALAAVGSAYTLMIFLTSLVIGLCMGNGALFSMHYGANNLPALRKDAWLSALFIGAGTVLIYIIILPGKDWILHALQIPGSAYAYMDRYVSVIFLGLGFVALYNYFAYLLRSIGNSMTPLVFLALASVMNIGLDVLFVAKLGRGVRGAAEATVIAQAFSGVGIACFTIKNYAFLLPDKYERRFDRKRLIEIIRNDLATGLQQSVMNFGILMIQGLVDSFGTTVMAAFAAAVKIDTLAYMPAQEFANAFSLFISQNYGAKKTERIRKGTRISMLTSVLFCMVVSAIVFALAPELMQIFVQAEETAVIGEGVRYLHIEGACYLGLGILMLWYGYFRGIQRPKISLVLTIVSLGTRVLLAYLFAPTTPLGVLAIWWAIPIGWALADLCGAGFYLHSKAAHL